MKTGEIADFLRGEIVGDTEIDIVRVADLRSATAGDIAYLEKGDPAASGASCIIASTDFSASLPSAVIRVRDPKLAFARIAAVLHPSKQRSSVRHPSAVISASAKIASTVFIDDFVFVGDDSKIGALSQLRAGAKIGDNVTIGENCVLHPNVVVEDGCVIGNNVILHAGVVVGADGFGYVRDENELVKFPQIGTVVIEDNVEIGANTCVDRGALGETRIGEGTKIDNLVQIAHNVKIGKRVVIAALTGISGSVLIEDDCVLAGQVGIADHVTLKSGAVIGAQSAVFPGKIVRKGVWAGTPIQPLELYKRHNAELKTIARLKDEVRKLKGQIDDLSRGEKL